MTTATLSSKNQIVVPTAIRRALGAKSGDKIVFVEQDNGTISICKQPLSIYDFVGILPPGDGDPVERIRKIRDMDD